MEYQMEELLPLVSALTDKFTSKESSSVTYETAQMLMEAVLFCIQEYEEVSGESLLAKGLLGAEEAYRLGYERVVQKIILAREVYDSIIEDFRDYGCVNYRNTIIEGMPRFFLRYNAKFCPQNHLLTLDYPTASPCRYQSLKGIDLICRYLCDIKIEKQLLDCFLPEVVRGVLKKEQEHNKTRYMSNLCELMLLHAIGCMVSGHNLGDLNLDRRDLMEIDRFFSGGGKKEIEIKIHRLVQIILEKTQISDSLQHFEDLCSGFAVRIESARTYGCLDNLF